MNTIIMIPVATAIVSLLVGTGIGYAIRKHSWEQKAQNAQNDADHILADAKASFNPFPIKPPIICQYDTLRAASFTLTRISHLANISPMRGLNKISSISSPNNHFIIALGKFTPAS